MIYKEDLNNDQVTKIEAAFKAVQYWYPEFVVVNLLDIDISNDKIGVMSPLINGQTYFQALANPEKKMLLVLTKVRLNRQTRAFYDDETDPHWLFLAKASVVTNVIEVMPKNFTPMAGNFNEVPVDYVSYPQFSDHYRIVAEDTSEAIKLLSPDRMKLIEQVQGLDFGLMNGVFLARTTMELKNSDWLHLLKLAYGLLDTVNH